MQIILVKNYDEMSKKAAEIFLDLFLKKDNPILGLATGSTPEGLYKELVKLNKEGKLSFKGAKTVNLDEYVGLDKNYEQSYHYFMNDRLFNHIDILPENINIPSGDGAEASDDYNKLLDEIGRRDIQLVGLGENGHIAFNEPKESLSMRSSIVELSNDTIKVNSRFFTSIDEVPRKAISMGMKDILNCDMLLLLANGLKKREAIKRLLTTKEIDTRFPASLIHLHPNVILIVDEEAYCSF